MTPAQEKPGCLSALLNLFGVRQRSTSAEVPPSPRIQPLTSAADPAYQRSDSVFTYRERVFYGALLEAIDGDYWTFAKVRLADFIWLPKDAPERTALLAVS
jgi:hypothetical protein